MTHSRILLVDCGAYSIKAAIVDGAPLDGAKSSGAYIPPQFVVVPNAVGASSSLGRGIVGTSLTSLGQYHSLMMRRPMEKHSLLVDGELQMYVFEHLLECFHILDESGIDLVLTVPFGMPEKVLEMWAATVGGGALRFRTVTLVSSQLLALVAIDSSSTIIPDREPKRSLKRTRETVDEEACSIPRRGTGIVVDCGFSGTTITPFVDYYAVRGSIGHLSVGGKLLTNRLKEVLSFSQVNLLEDTWIVNVIKERTSYVIRDIGERKRLNEEYAKRMRLKHWRGALFQQSASPAPSSDSVKCQGEVKDSVLAAVFVLPTIPAALPAGCLLKDLPPSLRNTAAKVSELQTVVMAHEAFMIPEILFCPADVGIAQRGIGDAVTECLERPGTILAASAQSNQLLYDAVLARVISFGGTSQLPGFTERLENEMRSRRRVNTEPWGNDPCAVGGVSSWLGSALPNSLPAGPSELMPLIGASILFADGGVARLKATLGDGESSDVDRLIRRLERLRCAVISRGRVSLTSLEKESSDNRKKRITAALSLASAAML